MKWRNVSATETIAVLEQPDREEKSTSNRINAYRFFRLKCLTEPLQEIFSRQDAKSATCHFDRREKSFSDPSHSFGMTGQGTVTWRALRPFGFAQDMLWGSPRGIVLGANNLTSIGSGFHGASHLFVADSVSQYSTDNFKYVWLDF